MKLNIFIIICALPLLWLIGIFIGMVAERLIVLKEDKNINKFQKIKRGIKC